MTAARGLAFTTAVGVIDRVHGDAADVRTEAHVTNPTGLAEVLVHVVGVGHRAHRGHAAVEHHAQLARTQTDLGVAGVAADQLGVGASRTGHLGALLGLQLDVVDDGADRHATQRHGVARLHVHALTGHNLVARLEALRRDDVGQFAIGVLHQGDEGRTVRIVFQPLDGGRHVPLAPLEVDDTVQPLGPAAAETDRDTATAATTARLGQAFDERLLGLALVKFAAIDQDQATLAGRGRIKMLERHSLSALTDRS